MLSTPRRIKAVLKAIHRYEFLDKTKPYSFLSITCGKYQGQELLAYESDISSVCGTTELDRDCSPIVDKKQKTTTIKKCSCCFIAC